MLHVSEMKEVTNERPNTIRQKSGQYLVQYGNHPSVSSRAMHIAHHHRPKRVIWNPRTGTNRGPVPPIRSRFTASPHQHSLTPRAAVAYRHIRYRHSSLEAMNSDLLGCYRHAMRSTSHNTPVHVWRDRTLPRTSALGSHGAVLGTSFT